MNDLAIDLARIQFGFTIAFHIIFPAFSIGLASFIAVLEGKYLRSKKHIYLALSQYWTTIFALVFGMGVVSGLVMSYQFGTNWSVFSEKTGPIIGPLMGYEVLSAFFLEAGFLGIMLFGRQKVSEKIHFASVLIVAIGTVISATWILSVNSWMQTPAGYAINEQGQFIATDWLEVIFNPSFPYRFFHMLLAAYLATAFLIAGVSAFHLLKKAKTQSAKILLSMSLGLALFVTPLQIVMGDLHGLNTLEHQPMKVAAMEGLYNTEKGAPWIVIGLPNNETETVDYALKIPYLGSLILTHTLDGEIKGLNTVEKSLRPPVTPVFFSFRIMVFIGGWMLLLALIGQYLRFKNKLYQSPFFWRLCYYSAPCGFIAILAGWITTEVGRQPYTVYGLLTTYQSASPLDAPVVLTSLIGFVVVYCFVFGTGIYYLCHLMARPLPKEEK